MKRTTTKKVAKLFATLSKRKRNTKINKLSYNKTTTPYNSVLSFTSYSSVVGASVLVVVVAVSVVGFVGVSVSTDATTCSDVISSVVIVVGSVAGVVVVGGVYTEIHLFVRLAIINFPSCSSMSEIVDTVLPVGSYHASVIYVKSQSRILQEHTS